MAKRQSPHPSKPSTRPNQSTRPRRPASSKRKPGRRRINAADRRKAMALLIEPVFYMDAEAFHGPDAHLDIFDNAPAVMQPDTAWYHPLINQSVASDQSSKPAKSQVLTAAEERILFLQYNFARFRLEQLRQEIGDDRPRDSQVRQVFDWYECSRNLRTQIAECNLALVLAMAKRVKASDLDFGDLVSEGNMALLRSIDKFDIERGFKFSTYACRAILKSFSRLGMKQSRYRQRFPTEFDPLLEKSNEPAERRREDEMERAAEAVHVIVQNTADLTDIEQEVIHHRFGMDAGAHGRRLTLAQVGSLIGLTKERVRQIQNRALEKLRDTLSERYLPTSDRDTPEPLFIPN
ncbi:MAG: sigma-70 family RNA polymerase sigma factor [Phycisphaerales bacterium]|nr:sigma-70 family RNA polymerase sigma factor [Phycisphaerales bacterium]